MRRTLATAAGILADMALGEPSVEPHPVAAFGSAMTRVEDRLWADDRGAGVAHAAAGILIGATAGALLGSTAASTYVAVAGRQLRDTATTIGAHLTAGDLEGARLALPALVGRDASELDADEMARAVVESVAENTVDAVVAPAFWAVAGGASGVLAHRAANTMDAMVGHRSPRYERYGWAAARLDDAMAWVPARATALLVAAVRRDRAGEVWRAVRDDAPAHPSPNSGVAEAAFAAALGIRLGGPSRYGDRVEERARLGDGRACGPGDIARAARLSRDVTLTLVGGLAILGLRPRRPKR